MWTCSRPATYAVCTLSCVAQELSAAHKRMHTVCWTAAMGAADKAGGYVTERVLHDALRTMMRASGKDAAALMARYLETIRLVASLCPCALLYE